MNSYLSMDLDYLEEFLVENMNSNDRIHQKFVKI